VCAVGDDDGVAFGWKLSSAGDSPTFTEKQAVARQHPRRPARRMIRVRPRTNVDGCVLRQDLIDPESLVLRLGEYPY